MGLLDALRKQKQETQPESEPIIKTPLRLYLESLIAQVDQLDLDNVKVAGLPFGFNPKQFLPLIVKNISDEMLEKLADFILIIANDVTTIRAGVPIAIEIPQLEAENVTDEIIADSTELQEK